MSHRNLLLLLATGVLCYACYLRAEQNPYARYVAAGYSVIDRWSLLEIPDQELFAGAVTGMVHTLQEHGDEYSTFVDATHRQEFREARRQEFGGIGVRIRPLGTPPLPTIVSPPRPGTPAAENNLRMGDRIQAIDGLQTVGRAMEQILAAIRGPVGTPITLTIQRLQQAELLRMTLQRQVISVASLAGARRDRQGAWQFRLVQDPRIGYVRIEKFGDKTVSELTHVLARLTGSIPTADPPATAPPIAGLILDVRDNNGGALDAAVAISDLFLQAGLPILTTRGRDQVIRDRFVATARGMYTKLPLVLLLNSESASASEILAACLQDHRRAVIVGERSFGKGTVQRVLQIESGRSLVKLTSATYWRPSGQNIHRMAGASAADAWGVQPTAGCEVKLDAPERRQWRQYRLRRDLQGHPQSDAILAQVDAEFGQLPDAFRDRALDRAVEQLQQDLPSP